jgi:predicted NBD/HSP70 family sugar kinase
MVNLFDPDGFLIGGGALEASAAFREWFVAEVRAGMPPQREEQVPRIEPMPDGDTAGARGAALEAVRVFGL